MTSNIKTYVNIAFILLSIQPALKAQVDYTQTYHPLIMKAESAILDSNYEAALKWYQKAFQFVPRGFAKDHYNALICAVELGQMDIAFPLLDSLMAKGVKKSFFEKSVPLQPLKKHPKWLFFIQTFDSRAMDLNRTQNHSLKQILAGMAFADQEFRNIRERSGFYKDTIRQIDKRNAQILAQLIQKYGFPNEHLLGVENPSEMEHFSDILFTHQCQKMSTGTPDFDFTDEMMKAVQKGELSPHRMTYWLSLQNRAAYQYGGNGIFQLFHRDKVTGFLALKYSPDKKNAINQRRKELGIENLDDFYKKILLKVKQKGIHKFVFGAANVTECEFSYQADFENALKDYEPLE